MGDRWGHSCLATVINTEFFLFLLLNYYLKIFFYFVDTQNKYKNLIGPHCQTVKSDQTSNVVLQLIVNKSDTNDTIKIHVYFEIN